MIYFFGFFSLSGFVEPLGRPTLRRCGTVSTASSPVLGVEVLLPVEEGVEYVDAAAPGVDTGGRRFFPLDAAIIAANVSDTVMV